MNAVVLLAHGAPRSLEEIEPFLRSIRRGRPAPPEIVAEVKRRYALIGGCSPLPEITFAQARGLQERLGALARVAVGMKHGAPSIAEAVAEARAAGARRFLGLPLVPQASEMTTAAYRHALAAALGAEPEMAPSYCDHPLLAEAFAERVREAMAAHPGARPVLLFTVHSLPARIVADGDPYPAEFRRTAEAIAARLGGPPYRLAYQSQGMTDDAWLGPPVPEVLRALACEGWRDVLLVPVGFVADNVEILYDVDIDLRAQAEPLGIRLWRTASLNDSPRFLDLLEAICREALERAAAPRGREGR
jgi:ferrochelatase